jgi:hypothetical protein
MEFFLTTESKEIFKCLSYASHLQKGNKPRNPNEALKKFVTFLNAIEILSRNKERYSFTFDIITPDGNKKNVELLDDCGYFLHHLYPVIISSPDENKFAEYLCATTKFLESSAISLRSKIYIIDFENQYFKEILEQAFSTVAQGLTALHARIKLCSVAFSSPNNDNFGDEKSIRNQFSLYVSKSIEYFVNKGQFLQADDYLKQLLVEANNLPEKSVLVNSIISHNSSFNLSIKSDLNFLLEEYEEYLESEELEILSSMVNAEPGGMVVHGFSFGNGTLSKNSIKDRKIVTLIRFSIPNSYLGNIPQQIDIDENIKIFLSPVSAFWSDPMFKMMSSWKIANMGWSHFCDVEAEEGSKYTHVQIIINELYIPDIVLKDDGNDSIDFSDENAINGRTYYPHKEFVIKCFLDNFPLLKKHIKINKKDISINLFSNYVVQHIDESSGENIHQKLYAITNPDSYSKTLTRFVERLNSVNLADAFIDVRELMLKTKIETEKSLKEFVFRCVDLFVKHNIENHGGYKYLWKNDENGEPIPCREPETQPYIFTHLKAIFDFMGIQISREVESSNGEVDFLISFTNRQNKSLKLCIELKLAHADNIEKGLTKQLPTYLKGERCKYGVYLVLWYKCDLFVRPKKYKSLNELENYLNKINANENISNLIIDCTKPTSPSKLR